MYINVLLPVELFFTSETQYGFTNKSYWELAYIFSLIYIIHINKNFVVLPVHGSNADGRPHRLRFYVLVYWTFKIAIYFINNTVLCFRLVRNWSSPPRLRLKQVDSWSWSGATLSLGEARAEVTFTSKGHYYPSEVFVLTLAFGIGLGLFGCLTIITATRLYK